MTTTDAEPQREGRLTRRAGLRTGVKLAFIAPAVLAVAVPGEASASSKASRPSKARRLPPQPQPRVAPMPAPAVVPITQPAAPPAQTLTTPNGVERMVSDRVRLHGRDGTGAGPLRVDLDGARPDTVYEVTYVPAAGGAQPVALGTVRTDARGAFHGNAPQEVPALDEPARSGVLVLRRLQTQ